MKALDTNILVRFLVKDDEAQSKRVLTLFESAEKTGTQFFVTHLVLLELLWVLDSAYQCTRAEILGAIEALLGLSVITFENEDVVRIWLEQGKGTSLELDDLLIGIQGIAMGCDDTLTFDRKASRSDLFALVGSR